MIHTKPLGGRALKLATALALTLCVAAPSVGADDPHDIADQRFAAMNGPMVPFVVTPDRFGMDATKVLTDIPPLLGEVDAARLREDTTELAARYRSSQSSQAELDAATDYVTSTFRDMGYDPQLEPVTLDGKSMPNVSVTIPGTACSNRVLVLSAHYDAKGPTNPGADDDASGMAGLFEIARILRDHPQPVTIRLVGFSFEEDGLVGSRVMAAHDAQVGTDIVGAVSMDMIGYTDPQKTDPFVGLPADYLAMVADPSSAELAHAFGAASYTYLPAFAAAGAVIDPSVLPDIFRSDHFSFVSEGYPGMIVTDTANFRNPNYHTPNDTLATIDWDFVTNSTKAVLAGMTTFASSDQDANGIADLCPGGDPGTTTTTTTTVPGSSTTAPGGSSTTRPGTTAPGSENNGSAEPATPVVREPDYAG